MDVDWTQVECLQKLAQHFIATIMPAIAIIKDEMNLIYGVLRTSTVPPHVTHLDHKPDKPPPKPDSS